MKILITGIAGFIGSNFSKWILENTEHEIIGIDNLSTGFIDNLSIQGDAFFLRYDIRDSTIIDQLFSVHKPNVCYHFAAYAAEGRSNYIRSFIHSNNTIGSANIINACVNHKCKLIFTSSVAVYSGLPPFTEETIPNPIDEYGLSKWTTEKSIEIAGKEQGLDWCIIRPRNVYGENQSMWDTARNVMGIWMHQILNDKPMTIFGDGSNRRTFTYIGDILEPLYNAIKIEKQVINLGAKLAYTIIQANEVLQEVTGYEKIEFLEPRHEVNEAICNTEKSEQLLGYADKTGLYSGLKKMWEWAKKQPIKELQPPPQLEIFKTNHSTIT